MTPVEFTEANAKFGPPKDLEETQCRTVPAYIGQVRGGSVDGSNVIITAWKPSEEDLVGLNKGQPVYLSIMAANLPPHLLTLDFKSAISPS